MSKQKNKKLRGKDLKAIGFEDNTVASLALQVLNKYYKHDSLGKKTEVLRSLLANPEDYRMDKLWSPVALKLLQQKEIENSYVFEDKPFSIFGEEYIAQNAIEQMRNAMRLPIAINGALMPDAHHGYGLPIGGVLATEGAIIPYGVGVDIGCRMCLSVFDLPASKLETERSDFKKILHKNSKFGKEVFDDYHRDDAIFDRPEFSLIPTIRRLKDKAYTQIGSSGGGNHFVEFGIIKITDINNALNLPAGEYLALLTHSGSRGLGATIAQTYTRIAGDKRNLPKGIAHLSWLYMDEQEGQEYWTAMNLAGDYASACHHHIHRRINQAIGGTVLKRIENHHNFAWNESLADGKEVFIHRKGATPAKKGEWGIIPGSMTAPAFIVQGLGNSESLQSASHGAGRLMSRQQAKSSFNKKMLRQELKKKNVDLIGAGLDEAPFAYKDIHDVIQAQQDLVDVVAAFYPKIVRMEG